MPIEVEIFVSIWQLNGYGLAANFLRPHCGVRMRRKNWKSLEWLFPSPSTNYFCSKLHHLFKLVSRVPANLLSANLRPPGFYERSFQLKAPLKFRSKLKQPPAKGWKLSSPAWGLKRSSGICNKLVCLTIKIRRKKSALGDKDSLMHLKETFFYLAARVNFDHGLWNPLCPFTLIFEGPHKPRILTSFSTKFMKS